MKWKFFLMGVIVLHKDTEVAKWEMISLYNDGNIYVRY
jgi:hypothetical protein